MISTVLYDRFYKIFVSPMLHGKHKKADGIISVGFFSVREMRLELTRRN